MKLIHTVIRLKSMETKTQQHVVDLGVPRAASLLETIEALVEFAHEMLLAWHCESFRLLHEDFFVEITVEECSIDIHLVNLEILMSRQSKQGTNRREFGDRCERFIEVDTFRLREALS